MLKYQMSCQMSTFDVKVLYEVATAEDGHLVAYATG